MKTTTIRLYSLDYGNVKTYFAVALSFWATWLCHNFAILSRKAASRCFPFISLRLSQLINMVGK